MAPKRRAPEITPPAMEGFSTPSRESAISMKRSAGSEKENGDSKKPLFVEGNVGSGKEGKDPIFGKPQKAFELSQKICEVEEMVDANGKTPKSRTTKGSKKNDEEMSNMPEEDEEEEMVVETPNYSAESICSVRQLIKYSGKVGRHESVIMEGMELISASSKSDWVARWKTMDIEALGILVEKLELLLEMKKTIYLALKSKMNYISRNL